MSLPHALLTALLERPASGSDLASRFDRSIGHFWHASHQQIYRELARLEEAGWIESLPEEPTRGRKRAYRIMPAGRDALREWLDAPDEPMVLRDALLVRLRAEAIVGPTGLDEEVRRHLALHQDKLAQYQAIEARDFPDGAPADRGAALQHVVLRGGIRYETQWVELLTDALEVLMRPVSGSAGQ